MSREPLRHPPKPCGECPWRRDVNPGRFPPERFAALASTAYDMSPALFQCHKTSDAKPIVCAGFLLRGAEHNFAVRMAVIHGEIDPRDVSDGGAPLFDCYRDMAAANGVDPEDGCLAACR